MVRQLQRNLLHQSKPLNFKSNIAILAVLREKYAVEETSAKGLGSRITTLVCSETQRRSQLASAISSFIVLFPPPI